MFNTAVDRGSWIQTYSGLLFHPGDPQPEEICIEDIAHALSLQCRFTGHVQKLYSVAQHSWFVSKTTKPENALWGLLHDASEAYLVDVARPVKHHPLMMGYRILEDMVMKAVAKKFGLEFPIPQDVKDADNRLLLTEKRDLLPNPDYTWSSLVDLEGRAIQPLPDKLTYWQPEAAEHAFLERFKELTIEGYQGN
jgi:hypothetical protein